MKTKLKQTILIALMIVLIIVLCNDYYTIITTAQHDWARYMSNRHHMVIELFTINFLFAGCVIGLVIA